MKEEELGRAWIIMSRNRNEVLANRLYYKEWDDNLSIATEVLVLLELVQVIIKKSRNIREEKIITAIDCNEMHKLIVKTYIRLQN